MLHPPGCLFLFHRFLADRLSINDHLFNDRFCALLALGLLLRINNPTRFVNLLQIDCTALRRASYFLPAKDTCGSIGTTAGFIFLTAHPAFLDRRSHLCHQLS